MYFIQKSVIFGNFFWTQTKIVFTRIGRPEEKSYLPAPGQKKNSPKPDPDKKNWPDPALQPQQKSEL